MRNLKGEKITMNCRSARKYFGVLADSEIADPGMEKLSDAERTEIYRHIETCSRCDEEYKLVFLSRAALDLASSPEPVRPTEDFFKGLRARIERGPQPAIQPQSIGDESWAAALFLTARQLIPVMAVLLVVIIGATLIWKSAPKEHIQTVSEFRPRDKVIFNDIYEFPEPTRDDVLETLVAVEEKHGK
jgi:hypothetical protein